MSQNSKRVYLNSLLGIAQRSEAEAPASWLDTMCNCMRQTRECGMTSFAQRCVYYYSQGNDIQSECSSLHPHPNKSALVKSHNSHNDRQTHENHSEPRCQGCSCADVRRLEIFGILIRGKAPVMLSSRNPERLGSRRSIGIPRNHAAGNSRLFSLTNPGFFEFAISSSPLTLRRAVRIVSTGQQLHTPTEP